MDEIADIKRRAGINEMASPHSKSRLFAFLDEFTAQAGGEGKFVELGLNHPKISDETYGRSSRIYIHTGNPKVRQMLEKALQQNGFKVHTDYHPGSGIVEVEVSYFKGHNWDE